jgi:hypothetical protein
LNKKICKLDSSEGGMDKVKMNVMFQGFEINLKMKIKKSFVSFFCCFFLLFFFSFGIKKPMKIDQILQAEKLKTFIQKTIEPIK